MEELRFPNIHLDEPRKQLAKSTFGKGCLGIVIVNKMGNKPKRCRSETDLRDKTTLPKQILYRHVSVLLDDISLENSGHLSLFEQYRLSGVVNFYIDGKVVVRKRKHWKAKLKASRYFYEPVKRKTNRLQETVFDELEYEPVVFIQVVAEKYHSVSWNYLL